MKKKANRLPEHHPLYPTYLDIIGATPEVYRFQRKLEYIILALYSVFMLHILYELRAMWKI